MKKYLLLFIALFSTSVLAQTALKVNGQTITVREQRELLEQLIDEGIKDSPELKKYVRDSLIKEKIIEQEAKKQNIAKDKEVLRSLQTQKIRTYVLALAKKYEKENPPTEEELLKAYNDQKKDYNPNEIKFRHILVDTEKSAKDLIARLNNGEDIAELAKTESIDKGSSINGGLIPFTNVNQISDKDLASIALSLEKGKIFPVPFKSELGYHIIKLEDKRQVPLASYEQMKPQIARRIAQKKANEYLKKLYSEAKVVTVPKKKQSKK